MREDDSWGKYLKEEVQEAVYSEELKEQVTKRVTTSWWNREITIPASWAGGVMVLSLIIALSPLYGGVSVLKKMNVNTKQQVSIEQDYVRVNGMYVQRSLLVWGDQP